MFGTSKKTVSATGSSEPNTHLLRIKVVRAISLRERGLLGGPVDSYVKVLIQTRDKGNQTIDTTSTRIVPKTINPTWNQEFVLHVNPTKHRLAFEIYDRKNAVQDAFLGTFFVDLTANIPYESAGQSPSTREYALLQQTPHQNVRGNATVQLSYVRQPTIIPQKEVIDDRPLIKHVSPVTELPLPSGWEEKKTANGRTYYINHKTRTTTWERPKFEPADSPPSLEQVDDKEKKPTNLPKDSRDEATLKGSRDETSPKPTDELGPLPAGWDMTKTERGRPLFIDHINKRTTWTDPRKKQSNSETLPENWKVAKLPDGRKCYVDQLNKKTSWTPPSIDESAVPYTCNYQSKYQTFRRSLPKPKSDVASQLELPVDRKDILETSVRAVMSTKNTELFKTKLSIVFDGERDSDHDRLTSHWFFILSRQMFNPYYGLFEYSSLNSYTIQINPLSGLGNEEHIKYFRFVGRIVGMTLYHEKLLSVCLSPLFFKLLLSKAITLADIESIDQEYYQSLTFISENDPTDLELHFVGTEEALGDLREYELKPGGKKILVTQKNIQEYIELAIQYRYVKQIELQMNALKQGIEDIFPLDILKIFDEQELETLISGTTEIDLKDWRTHTMYKSGYTPNAPVIENFWKAIESFDNKQRTDLLRFVTDSSRLPLNGFRELIGLSGPQLFTIAKWDEKTKIPRSNTRFNRLYLPPYDSYEDLREKRIEAVKNGRIAQNEETIEEVEETSAVIEKAVITVEKGDLTKQKVDVIIGSSSSTFLKKALLEAAGSEIETAYDNEYKKIQMLY